MTLAAVQKAQVVVIATFEEVIAAIAEDHVIARGTNGVVMTFRAFQDVVSRRPNDSLPAQRILLDIGIEAIIFGGANGVDIDVEEIDPGTRAAAVGRLRYLQRCPVFTAYTLRRSDLVGRRFACRLMILDTGGRMALRLRAHPIGIGFLSFDTTPLGQADIRFTLIGCQRG